MSRLWWIVFLVGCTNNDAPRKPDAGCAPGTLACACDATGACQEGAFCDSQRRCSQPSTDCTPGTLECGCSGGGCNSGLRCMDNVCRDNTGFDGGPCLPQARCQTGNRCAGDVCVKCSPGTQGCTCTAAGCNDTLLCRDGMCVTGTGYASSSPPPTTGDSCVTPCSGGLVAPDGSYVACPDDGVMPGCLKGLSCDHGQCICPGGEPRSCTADVDCADFHACLNGFCRTNCRGDTDCRADAACHRRVCHKRCDVSKPDDCPVGLLCHPSDGQSGVCIMRSDLPASPAPAQAAEIKLPTPSSLRFTPSVSSGSVVVENSSPFDAMVTVRKLRQREPDPLTRAPITLELSARERGPTVDGDNCASGSRNCRCGADSGHPCNALSDNLTLACESGVCVLPTCTGGTEGCVCTGADCRQVCQPGHCPLAWLSLSVEIGGIRLIDRDKDVIQTFRVPGNGKATLVVEGPEQSGAWDGALEIEPAGGGSKRQELLLSYANTPEGRWAGEMYYFGDFPVSTAGLDAWRSARAGLANDPAGDAVVNGIRNAFVEKWADFRRGRIDYHTMKQVLIATREESWRSSVLTQICGPHGWICYPDDSPDGYEVYSFTPSLSAVPAGVVQMPFALSLAPSADGLAYSGAVDSTVALQYPGSPAVALSFTTPPAGCTPGSDGNCLSFLDAFGVTSVVGGRYATPTTVGCAGRYRDVKIPWLVPGFEGRSHIEGDRRYLDECREARAPFISDDDDSKNRNGDISAANPFLDGRERTRTIELVDGVSINGDTMLLLFRERTPPLVESAPDSGVEAYGFISLHRDDAPAANPTSQPGAMLTPPPAEATPPTGCAAARPTLQKLADKTGQSVAQLLDGTQWPLVARALYTGIPSIDNNVMTQASSWALGSEEVHALCEDTDEFENGADQCPSDSPVIFFTINTSLLSGGAVTGGGGKKKLQDWIAKGSITQQAPSWRCASGAITCSRDPFDPRKNKEFYPASSQALFLPLGNAVDETFRYRTRFANRSGTNLGFVPQICGQGQQTLPYCYTPAEIAALEQRHDCLLEIFADHYDDLRTDTVLRDQIAAALREAFSDRDEVDIVNNTVTQHPGFEKLRAELLVMLGDDAFVKALGSRFDLAGLGTAAFEGTLLESGGINLSGVAGAEMFNLYLATQYYQLVLERLSASLPRMWRVIEQRNASYSPQIIGGPTVVDYLGRAIRASSQKARLLAEIAKRYQNIDRGGLARHVIERAYITGYMESMVMTTLMRTIVNKTSNVADVPQIRNAIWQQQLTYRAALSDMSEQYRNVSDDVNFFGFPRDYIPFPALEEGAGRDSAFDVALARAKELMEIARADEQQALASTRNFDTDAVSFQNELARISNTYEAQLSEICGTFSAGGTIYPAISRYADLLPGAVQPVGDPCGKTNTGGLFQAVLGVQVQAAELERVRVAMSNVIDQVRIEQDRINSVCQTNLDWKNAVVKLKNKELNVSAEIQAFQAEVQQLDRERNATVETLNLTKCSIGTSEDCTASIGAIAGVAACEALFQGMASTLETSTHISEIELQELQNQEAVVQFDFMCNSTGTGTLQIESRANVLRILLEMKQLKVDWKRELIQLSQAMAQVQQQRNQERRLSAEMEENFQLTINLEAARNDPNIRIYRNDAVIQSDLTFTAALREAYRATRVYEYYTSQTYPDRDKLLLSRMVAQGDSNLESYLLGLQDTFHSFEDEAGVPDLRVLVMSLRDDILSLPYTTECGAAVSAGDRVAMLQRQLSDPAMLDSNGYIVVPFRVGPEQVSPLTRNHKLRFVEAQLVGGNGDPVGRVYVRSAGTGMVSTLGGDDLSFYAFPKRTGVVNVYFSVKTPEYDPAVYRTNRFFDRPLMNTRWELILNMKDEPANLDFAIKDINDIRLYFYYTDFTNY